jgi:hypothetical protein
MGRPPKGVPPPKKIEFVVKKNPKDIESALQISALQKALQKELDRLRRMDEAGDHAKLLEAVEVFLTTVAPGSYLAETFARRFRSWELWEVPDLADAFKVKRTSDPRTIAGKRREMQLRWEVLSFLINCKRGGMLHKPAVKRTAEKFRVSASYVEALYRGNPEVRAAVENMPTPIFAYQEDLKKI